MIGFTGDVFLADAPERVERARTDAFRECDLMVTNFESVLRTEDGIPREDKLSILTSTEGALRAYLAGVSGSVLFTLSNNHIHDFGAPGIVATVEGLRRHGCEVCGVGTIDEVLVPKVVESDGKRIALLPVSTDEPEVMSKVATPTFAGSLDYNDSRIVPLISEWKSRVDFVVVLPHWGKEHIDYPSVQLRKRAHAWIDAGADLVIGTHPHVIQGKEAYRGRWIYYSLGNYIFPNFADKNGIWSEWKRKSCLSVALRVAFDEGVRVEELGFEFDPQEFRLRASRTALDEMERKSDILDLLKYSFRRYFPIWERNYLAVVSRQYGTLTRIRRILFPRHIDHGVIRFFVHRVRRRIGRARA